MPESEEDSKTTLQEDVASLLAPAKKRRTEKKERKRGKKGVKKYIEKDEEHKALEAVVFPSVNFHFDNPVKCESEETPEDIKPAWTDEDSHPEEASELCWKKTIGNQPSWLKAATDHLKQGEDDSLLSKVGTFLSSRKCLPAKILRHSHVAELNRCSKSEGALVSAVEFHPWAKVALVAGRSGVVSLVEVDGKENAKIHSVQFNGFPIRCAHFSTSGEEFLVGSGAGPHFFSYDILSEKVRKSLFWNKKMEQMSSKKLTMSPDGKHFVIWGLQGHLHLMSARSKEWIETFKVNGDVSAVAFSPQGDQLLVAGDDGTGGVSVWDMTRRVCVHRFLDEGSTKVTSVAVSPSNDLVATGGVSGIINLYDRETCTASHSPKPLKAFMNLTTEVSEMKFNSTSELLFMSSGVKKNAFRIAHVASRTVFSNFPGPQTNLHRVVDFDVSPHSGYLGHGNNVGGAPLIRLAHFDMF